MIRGDHIIKDPNCRESAGRLDQAITVNAPVQMVAEQILAFMAAMSNMNTAILDSRSWQTHGYGLPECLSEKLHVKIPPQTVKTNTLAQRILLKLIIIS